MKIAIIPARGGSKRIPNKNINLFHGKPIIAYAIENAIHSKLFDEVFVSTDNEKIAEIAKNLGADVPVLRSEANADDYATTSDVLVEVLEHYQKINKEVDSACCIYPTTPLLSAADLIAADRVFIRNNFDVLLSCVAYDFPIQRAFELTEASTVQLREPQHINERSQDLPKTYHDAGAFYFFSVKPFLENKSLWLGNIGAYPLPESKVQDIDTPEDWTRAELKYQLLKNE